MWDVLSLCFWQESESERQGACAGEPECLRVLLPVIMIIARFLAVCEHVRLVAVLFSKAHAFRGVCLCLLPLATLLPCIAYTCMQGLVSEVRYMLAMRWCATRPAYALALEVLQANPSQYSHRLCRSSVVVFGARLGAKVKPRPSREGDLVSSQPHLVFRASRACKSRIPCGCCGQGEERRQISAEPAVCCPCRLGFRVSPSFWKKYGDWKDGFSTERIEMGCGPCGVSGGGAV